MKRRHWIKTVGAAVAGLAVATRLRAKGEVGTRDAKDAVPADATEAKGARESRRYVHGFETELMR